MYIGVRYSFRHKYSKLCKLVQLRSLSSAEIQQALRPFYFSVHPDLFGRFPEQRATNEESLKQLSAHLEALQNHYVLSSTPLILPFFVRATDKKGEFKLIKIPVEKTTNTKVVVTKILQSCSLSTEFIDKAEPSQTYEAAYRQAQQRSRANVKKETADQTEGFQYEVYKAREEESFKTWIEKNVEKAHERSKFSLELREEVDKLKEQVKARLELAEIKYECGWNVEHFSGCLKTLDKLADLHGGDMKLLKDRILVFAPFTGISLDGHVMLFTGDVQRNWLDLLKNIPKHDHELNKIPAYEHALSQVLLNIRIRRRKFMPKTQAMEYTKHLRKVTTSLLDYLSTSKYPKVWHEDLSKFKLVVESEAGPLMVSWTGQFIVPCLYPGRFLVDFITTHMDEALEKIENYNKIKHVERELTKRCIEQFQLSELLKSESITATEMIICLNKLLECKDLVLKNLTLNITNYYSVLRDGTINIPFDWK